MGVATVTTAAACGSSKTSKSNGGTKSVQASGSGAAANDATITACANDSTLNYGQATVVIKNNTSKTSNYIVEVAFDTADGKTQISTGTAAANNLEPGQSTTQTADITQPLPAGATCKVANVTRYAS